MQQAHRLGGVADAAIRLACFDGSSHSIAREVPSSCSPGGQPCDALPNFCSKKILRAGATQLYSVRRKPRQQEKALATTAMVNACQTA
eukprot:1522437-Prymnesium_polylepis.1